MFLKVVHEKFIRRGDKVFGPYLYENKRVDGKVVTSYIGQKPNENKNRKLAKNIFVLLGVVISVVLLVVFFKGFTGNAVLDLKSDYVEGSSIAGTLNLVIKEGELIPKDSQVLVFLGDYRQEFSINELLSDNLATGVFYLEGKNVAGEGEGYGLIGKKKVYTEIDFEVRVFDSGNAIDESNVSESVSEESNVSNEIPEEVQVAESVVESSSEEGVITGQVIEENEQIISGKVAQGENFEYLLESGQDYEIVSGSLKFNDTKLDDEEIQVVREGDKLIISTDYFYEEEGFGSSYIRSGMKEFSIDLGKLNIPAKEGELNVILSYNNEEIVSASSNINLANETKVIVVEEVNISLLKEIPNLRIALGGEASLNITDYFIGATSIVLEGQNISSNLNGEILTIIPDVGFKGAIRARIIAFNDERNVSSNSFNILVSSGAVNIQTSREKIRVGQPVKWSKNISLDSPENFTVSLPGIAEGVVVKKVDSVEEQVLGDVSLTGNVVMQMDLGVESEGLFTRFWNFILSSMTGNVIENQIAEESNSVEVVVSAESNNYIIEYETPAPELVERESDNGKSITIAGPDEVTYTDVIASSNLSNRIPISESNRIKLYWKDASFGITGLKEVSEVGETELVSNDKIVESMSSNIDLEIPFDYYDLDYDGNIDYIEWVVPHLSEQNFELIYIVKADILDENRNFVEDIYNQASALDENFSRVINSGEFVRVYFEKNLTSRNDITLYARGNGGQLNVYTKNGNESIARFDNIGEFGKYRVILSGLQGEEDVFDLEVMSGSLEIDYIIDPVESNAPNISIGSGTTSGNILIGQNFSINLSTADQSDYYTFVNFNNSLVGWWTFDNYSTGTIYDESGYGNNMVYDPTFSGGIGWNLTNVSGPFNTCNLYNTYLSNIEFPSLINISYADSLNMTNFSISFWHFYEPTGNERVSLIGKNYSNPDWEIYRDNLGYFYLNASSGLSSLGNCSFQTNCHIVVTVQNDSAKIYLNGNLDNSGSIGIVNNTASDLYIDLNQGWGTGNMDELLIFNRVLGADEVSALYNTTSVNQYVHNFTNLSTGSYSYKGYARDTNGNNNYTSELSFLSSAFDFSLISPLSKLYNSSSIWTNISSTLSAEYCLYSNDSFVTNHSMSSVNSTYFASLVTFNEGYNTLDVWCNNSDGSSINRRIDFDVSLSNADPAVYFISPSPSSGAIFARDSGNITVNSSVFSNNRTYAFFNEDLLAWYQFENDSIGNGIYDSVSGEYKMNSTVGSGGYGSNGGYSLFNFNHNLNGSYSNLTYQTCTTSYPNGSCIIAGANITLNRYPVISPKDYNYITDFATSSFTVSGWIRTGNYTKQTLFFLKRGDGGQVISCRLIASGAGGVEILSSLDAYSPVGYTGSTNLSDNNWHQITCVRDISHEQIRVYADGVLLGSSGIPDTSSLSYVFNYNTNVSLLFIGSSVTDATVYGSGTPQYSQEYPVAGYVDEVMFFKRALGDSEIRGLYNASNARISANKVVSGNKTWTLSTIVNGSSVLYREDNNLSFRVENGIVPAISSPIAQSYSSLPISLSISTDISAGSITFSVDSGVTNYTTNTSNNLTFTSSLNSTVLSRDGNYKLNVYAFDSLGSLANDNVSRIFRFGQYSPSVTFVSPSPSSGASTSSEVVLNATISDSNSNQTYALYTTGITGWWRFDNEESKSENASFVYDWSDKGDDLTFYGTPVINLTGGKYGGSYYLDGVNDYASIANTGNRFDVGSFVLGAWIKSNDSSVGRKKIISLGNSTTGYYLAVNGSDFECGSTLDNLSNVSGYVGINITNNEWNQIVCVRDRTNGRFYWYLNGNMVRNVSITNSDLYDITANSYFGSNGSAEFYTGWVDEAIAFNRVLESSEISGYYNSSGIGVSRTVSSLSGAQQQYIKTVDSDGNFYSTYLSFNAPSTESGSDGSSSGGGGGATVVQDLNSPCYDSDGGKNYYAAGNVRLNNAGAISSYSDRCTSRDLLTEYYCEGTSMGSVNYDCKGTCIGSSCTRPISPEKFFFSGTKTQIETLIEKQSVGGGGYSADAIERLLCGELIRQSPLTASADSVYSGYPASNAIDGNIETRWHGEFTSEFSKSIIFDYEKKMCLKSVDLYFHSWDLPIKANLYVSNDGTNWEKVLNEVNFFLPRAIGVRLPKTVIARYVKIEELNSSRAHGELSEIKFLSGHYNETKGATLSLR